MSVGIGLIIEPFAQYLKVEGGLLCSKQAGVRANMGKERYDSGDAVPDDICSLLDGKLRIEFAVPVEVYHGYGKVKHVYPTEEIDETADLFARDEPVEVLVEDRVQLYTIPHQHLR